MNRHIPGVAVITVCCVDYERGSERSEYEWKGHRRTCWTRRIANPCVDCVGGEGEYAERVGTGRVAYGQGV